MKLTKHVATSSLIIGLSFTSYIACAQQKTGSFRLACLQPWEGLWKGTLTCLDDSSG